MKNTTSIYLLIPLFWICGCFTQIKQDTSNRKNYDPHRGAPTFQALPIESLDLDSLPDTGAYYKFQFKAFDESIENPAAMLSDLYSRGFDITHAWYRNGVTGCSHPSGIVTRTIYGPTFFVHLSHRDDGLELYNFSEISNPRSFGCPFNILELRPLKE